MLRQTLPNSESKSDEGEQTMLWVMAGGGTGGHIYPALALAAAVKTMSPDTQLLFVGGDLRSGAKNRPSTRIPAPNRHSETLSEAVAFAIKFHLRFGNALRHFPNLQPFPQTAPKSGHRDGRATLQFAHFWLANWLGLKLVLFEANSIPGRTNKLLAKLADWVATGFPEAVNFFPKGKATYTGVPIRADVRSMDKLTARKTLGLTENEQCLLVFGGSRGAQRINEALWDALPRLLLRTSLKIVHLCGSQWEQDAKRIQEALPEDVRERYQPFGYREDMPVLLHAADLALSRAGASSIAELLAAGVPSILIPYPFAIYDHQRFNALSVVRRGAAVMILNADLTGERLFETVSELLSSREKLERMRESALKIARPFAAEEIVKRTLELLG